MRFLRVLYLSIVALLGLCGAVAIGNYAVTVGAGTNFGSVVVGGIHYAQQFICDLTTPAQCAAVSAGGAVKVDGSAVTQPVSLTSTTITGTVAATQSGTWTVQPGNTANTTPWLVTGSGTAGSAATGVVTVQGIASMTPLFMASATAPVVTMNSASANAGINSALAGVFDDVAPTAITENSFGFLRMSTNRNLYGTIRDAAGNERGTNVDASNRLTTAPTMVSGSVASGAYASGAIAAGAQVDLLTMRGTVAAGTAAANSMLAGAVFNSTPITVANTQGAALQSDANGFLKVNIAAGAAAGGTSSNFGSAFPTPGTAIGFSDGTNMVAAKVGAVANVTAATNMLNTLSIAQYNATPLTVTDTRYQSLQSDINGFLKVNVATATGLAQGSTTSGQTGSMIMGAVTTANPSYTTAQTAYASLDVKGNVRTVLGGGVPITASATGTTGATTATLATSASVTTYICGFSIRANATAAATGNATVTGTITATMNFTQWTAPTASGLGVTEEIFSPCIPASAANTSIAVVSAAPGTGGVVSVSAWGYQQ